MVEILYGTKRGEGAYALIMTTLFFQALDIMLLFSNHVLVLALVFPSQPLYEPWYYSAAARWPVFSIS